MAQRVSIDREKIAVISNPKSRRNLKNLAAFSAFCDQESIRHSAPDDLDTLKKTLCDYAAYGVEILVINGGDGTVDTVLTLLRTEKLFNKEPVFALLRGGTTNMIHKDVGLRGRPLKALKRLLQSKKRETIARPPVMLREEGEDDRYGFFFGTGAIPRAIVKTRKSLHKAGMTGAFSEMVTLGGTVLKLIKGEKLEKDPILKPENVTMTDKSGIKRDYSNVFLLITTLNTLILGIKPVKSEKSAILIALNMPYRYFLASFCALARGRIPEYVPDNGILYEDIENIVLNGHFPWALDGELRQEERMQSIRIKLAAPVHFLKDAG